MKKEWYETDRLYSDKISKISDFKFDDAVAEVFPDMINRSVPGYSALVQLIGSAAESIISPDTNVYDLGCSLGAVSTSITNHCSQKRFKCIAVDNSQAMTKRCREALKENPGYENIEVICEDVCEINIENASLVVLNFTLQFIPREQRTTLIKKIYDGLNTGGIFILSEKIIFENREEQKTIESMYEKFKLKNGYSKLEISQKREALENVLIPETSSTHIARLNDCGFKKINKWFQVLNFLSMIAEK